MRVRGPNCPRATLLTGPSGGCASQRFSRKAQLDCPLEQVRHADSLAICGTLGLTNCSFLTSPRSAALKQEPSMHSIIYVVGLVVVVLALLNFVS